MSARYIQIADCTGGSSGHADTVILGGAGFEDYRETMDHWTAIPKARTTTYVVADLLDEDGSTILRDKSITVATAIGLLGGSITPEQRLELIAGAAR